jgi:hypothetical protein
MLEIGKTAHEFFEVVRPEHLSHAYNRSGTKTFRLKSIETYSREHKVMEQPSKRYFQATTLPDIINSYPMQKKDMTAKEIERGMWPCADDLGGTLHCLVDVHRLLITASKLYSYYPRNVESPVIHQLPSRAFELESN